MRGGVGGRSGVAAEGDVHLHHVRGGDRGGAFGGGAEADESAAEIVRFELKTLDAGGEHEGGGIGGAHEIFGLRAVAISHGRAVEG